MNRAIGRKTRYWSGEARAHSSKNRETNRRRERNNTRYAPIETGAKLFEMSKSDLTQNVQVSTDELNDFFAAKAAFDKKRRDEGAERRKLEQAKGGDETTTIKVNTIDNLPTALYVTLDTNGRSCRHLVDTGATGCCIAYDLFQKLKHRPPLEACAHEAFTADNKKLEVVGITTLTLRTRWHTYHQEYLVVRKLHPMCILGFDFMQAHGASVSPADGTLTIGGEILQHAGVSTVYTRKTTRVPPGEVRRLKCTADEGLANFFATHPYNEGNLLAVSPLTEDLQGLQVAEGVIAVHCTGCSRTLDVLVLNPTTEEVEVQPSMAVATLEEVVEARRQVSAIAGVSAPKETRRQLRKREKKEKERERLYANLLRASRTTRARLARKFLPLKIPTLNSNLLRTAAFGTGVKGSQRSQPEGWSGSPGPEPATQLNAREGCGEKITRVAGEQQLTDKLTELDKKKRAEALAMGPHGLPNYLTALYEDSVHEVQSDDQSKIKEMLESNRDIFAQGPWDLGHMSQENAHLIELKTATPVKSRVRRLSPTQSAECKVILQDMLKNGVIQPSISEYASPIVLVKKKNGSLRLCVDYRSLNDITIKNSYPLPRIDDILDRLGSRKYFATLDLQSGYWQIPIAEKDRHKTAFVTMFGLYEYTVIPFGLTNAPAAFQKVMNDILRNVDPSNIYAT